MVSVSLPVPQSDLNEDGSPTMVNFQRLGSVDQDKAVNDADIDEMLTDGHCRADDQMPAKPGLEGHPLAKMLMQSGMPDAMWYTT
jgi:hypothetical protein